MDEKPVCCMPTFGPAAPAARPDSEARQRIQALRHRQYFVAWNRKPDGTSPWLPPTAPADFAHLAQRWSPAIPGPTIHLVMDNLNSLPQIPGGPRGKEGGLFGSALRCITRPNTGAG